MHKFVFAVVGVFILLGIGFSAFYTYGTSQERVCTVTDKDRTRDAEGNSDMRIYTEDCGNFKVTDTVLRGVFNSSDLYAEIEPGSTYTFDTFGWRIPVLSVFPTIIGVDTAP